MDIELKLVNHRLAMMEDDLTITLLSPAKLAEHPHRETLELAGFEAREEQCCALHVHRELFVGIDTYTHDAVRDAVCSAIASLTKFGYESVKIANYGEENISAIVEAVVLGSYRFERYKSEPKPLKLKRVRLSMDDHEGNLLDERRIAIVVEEAMIVAKATNYTRDLVNMMPDEMTPSEMAITAESLAKSNALECNIYDEHALQELQMNAMLSVARASRHKPRLIHLAYKPKNPKKVISLVGKGLTYDSGGLSLKPSTSMVTMKMDKAGACAVYGMIKAISELKLNVEVHAFVGAVENMIGGDAYKPDDVLVAKNGTTIEVRNTDAEGRLVLADVLCFAQEKVEADYLFDFATLTGACMVALGQYTTGVMGHDATLKTKVQDASEVSGELVGFLPFNRHLKKLLKSEVADISNIGSAPYGGAITAALFLDKFITEPMKTKWLHFDIAGSAYTEKPWGVNPFGGTGSGVRLTTALMQQLIQE